MTEIQQIVLKAALTAAPCADDFKAVSARLPDPADGQVLVKTLYLSLDPYVGSVLRGRHMGEAAGQSGDVVPGRAIAKVLTSRHPNFKPGDIVNTETGWRSHAVSAGSDCRRIDPTLGPLSYHLGVLGMPGLTAYAGVHHLAKVKLGDTWLVSSAAGAVGSAVGQIARIEGAARVVGVAGGPEKCAMVTGTYGFDACIDYKQAGWKEDLATACPGGVSAYFDNVGGELLDTALANLQNYGRVVLCGLASQYHADDRPAGPNPGTYIGKRAHLMGLVVYDYYDQQADYARLASGWMKEGKLKTTEDRAQGLGQAPVLFEKLIQGRNIGKSIVVVDESAG